MTTKAFEFGLSTVDRVIAPDIITYGRPGRLPHKISRTERPKIASRTTVYIGGLLGTNLDFVHSVKHRIGGWGGPFSIQGPPEGQSECVKL